MTQREATEYQIIRVLVGSGVHGVAIEGTDDRDEMGVFIEHPARVFGTAAPLDSQVIRTQPHGARSGPGDLDLMLYSLRHFTRLALAGNPSILTLLYVRGDDVLHTCALGIALQTYRDKIVSQRAGRRFLGYLDGQRERLAGGGKRGRVPNRPELIEAYGYDTKYASHALRLGLQGAELLTEGTLTLPMLQGDRDLVLSVKRGEHTYEQALALVDDARARLADLVDNPPDVLRPEPDTAAVTEFVTDAHAAYWLWDYDWREEHP